MTINRAELVSESEQALSHYFDTPVVLDAAEPLSTDLKRAFRWSFEAPVSSPPVSSMIMKFFPWGPKVYAPTISERVVFQPFALELTGLRFVNTLTTNHVAFPKLYGVVDASRCLLIEDLKAPDALALFAYGSREDVEKSLLGIATALGELAALTAGRYEDYKKVFNSLAVGTRWKECWPTVARLKAPSTLMAFEGTCRGIGIELSDQARKEISFLISYTSDEEFYHYGNLDLRGGNMILKDNLLYLIDMELSRFMHVAAGHLVRLLYHPLEAGRIPLSFFAKMEAAYRAQLEKAFPIFSDHIVYQELISMSHAYHFLYSFCIDIRLATRVDRPLLRGTLRQYSMERVRLFLHLSEGNKKLEGLHDVAKRIIYYLDKTWGNKGRPPLLPIYEGLENYESEYR